MRWWTALLCRVGFHDDHWVDTACGVAECDHCNQLVFYR